MFMCFWENSHFLCIKHTETPKKYSIFQRQSGILTARTKMEMLAVSVIRMAGMFETSVRLTEVMKTMTPVGVFFLMMTIRAGFVYVCAGL